ncbi:MAG TPA: hypothetical protein VIU40_10160 [Geobacteraceae bacterium]
MSPLDQMVAKNEEAVINAAQMDGIPYVPSKEAAEAGLIGEILHGIPNLEERGTPEGWKIVKRIHAYHNEMQVLFEPKKGWMSYEDVVAFAEENVSKEWGYALIGGDPSGVVIGVFARKAE